MAASFSPRHRFFKGRGRCQRGCTAVAASGSHVPDSALEDGLQREPAMSYEFLQTRPPTSDFRGWEDRFSQPAFEPCQ
jgi:hypothetical protein